MAVVPKVKFEFSNLDEMIDKTVADSPDKIAMRIKKDGNYKDYSYKEFGSNVAKLSNFLHKKGLKNKKRIGLLSENCPQWGMAYFAIARVGAIVVPMDANLSESELFHIANDTQLSCIICSFNQYSKINEISSNLGKLKEIIIIDSLAKIKDKRVSYWGEIIAAGSDKRQVSKIDPDDVVVIIYTSGTTGVSKGVQLTHRNISANVLGLQQSLWYDSTDNFLSILPLHHTFETTAGLMIPLSKGATIVYAESLASKKIMANIAETKISIIIGVPLVFEKMALGLHRGISAKSFVLRTLFSTLTSAVKITKKITNKNMSHKLFMNMRKKAGLGSLRLMISGGAPLSPWIGNVFSHLGINFLNGYGLTETSPVLAVNRTGTADNRTVGPAIPGIELAIDKPNSLGVGELKARGDSIMKGYYKNKAATEEVLRDGWFYTGDLVCFDKLKRLIIAGRSKNILVTAGGKNIYPEEIEILLNDSKLILESLVLGKKLSNSNMGEEVLAYIVPDFEYLEINHSLSAGSDLKAVEEIIRKEVRKINQGLLSYKRIKDFKIRQEEFPKTSTRKIKRYLFQSDNLVL